MKRSIPVLVILTLLSFSSIAQFNDPFFQSMEYRWRMERYEHLKESGANVSAWQRGYDGYCFPMVSNATFIDKIKYVDQNDGTQHQMSVSRKINSTTSWGAYGGTFFPIAPMGEKSVLAICVEAEGAFIQFQPGLVTWAPDAHYDATFGAIMMSLPVSVDMKFGGEAKLDRSIFTSYTFGFGLAPTLMASGVDQGDFVGYSDLLGYPYFKTSSHPFIKAEFGIFVGVFIKCRAMYSFGKIKYFDYENNLDDNNGESVTISSKNYMSVGISLTDLSWDWKESAWWKHRHRR
jgi:hypothetical protein